MPQLAVATTLGLPEAIAFWDRKITLRDRKLIAPTVYPISHG